MNVAVFRALMLGDLLCATPALRALRAAHPKARITMVGLPWARALVQRLSCIDEFVAFPGWPGLPEHPLADAGELPRFFGAMRQRRFDLALQLHGSGATVNALVAAFGARRTAGFASPRSTCPRGQEARFIDWPSGGTEVERLLALTDHLGATRQGTRLDFPLRDADRDEAEALCAPLAGRRFAIVHPGSQLPSRRWPVERFAAVADALADEGLAIVLTGSLGEARLTHEVASAMRAPALDLAGRTTLWSLGALVEWAAQVVCNDTGISHIAAAFGTPSVVVSSGGDAVRWAPADRQRHRVLWHDLPCRPCNHVRCPNGDACALAIDTDTVQRISLATLHRASPAGAAHG